MKHKTSWALKLESEFGDPRSVAFTTTDFCEAVSSMGKRYDTNMRGGRRNHIPAIASGT